MTSDLTAAVLVAHVDEGAEDQHAVVLRNVPDLSDEMGPGLTVAVRQTVTAVWQRRAFGAVNSR